MYTRSASEQYTRFFSDTYWPLQLDIGKGTNAMFYISWCMEDRSRLRKGEKQKQWWSYLQGGCCVIVVGRAFGGSSGSLQRSLARGQTTGCHE